MPPDRPATYAGSGVDIDAGAAAVRQIADLARSTHGPEVVSGVGGFAGLFALAGDRYRQPVLVASADGVGTKLAVASATGRYGTIGIDLVAMCVDDLVCAGAEPLFLLDYIAVGVVDADHVAEIVAGVAEGCRQAGCALLGGETAEHPGTMAPDGFDLAGFAVGVVERDAMLPRTGDIEPGDVLVGLPSPGLRSNGYSLARAVLLDGAERELDDPAWAGADRSLADELLEPSVIYAPTVARLLDAVPVRAVAHITGGGLDENVSRVLPPGLRPVVDRRTWSVPTVFSEIQRLGAVADDEMARVFNMGIGMVVVVAPDAAAAALDVLVDAGHDAVVLGRVAERTA